MTVRATYLGVVAVAGVLLTVCGAPGWCALLVGVAISLISQQQPPAVLKRVTAVALQVGIIALGAGMNLVEVMRVGASGAVTTAMTLGVAIGLGIMLGRKLRICGDTPLLISIGTAICGGSAIAAVASVIEPEEHELSVSLAVVFALNAVGLTLFPVVGHALGLTEPVFGRWAGLAIHDTSSVVGAGLAYGSVALSIATTTKLARVLWIVPITLGVALARVGDGGDRLARLSRVRWPWFILGFVAVAAAFTWIPALGVASRPVVTIGQRALVLALYLIGLSLSRDTLSKVGERPFRLGLLLWLTVTMISLPLAVWIA